jgi:hypothetical protein
LSAYANREKIACCDPSAVFARSPHAERLFRDNAARFSAAGHELYARVLERFLVAKVAGPWRRSGPIGPDRRMSAGDQSLPGAADVRRADARGDQEPVSPAEFNP